MGISWKKASSNPAGQKNTTMETPWNILGNFLENRGHFLAKFLWKVHGNFIEKASDNPAVKKHPWKLYGTCMEHAWKIVDDVWESSCGNFISLKKAATTQQVQKKKPWKLHATCLEHSWKIVDDVWESSCGKFMGISLKKASNNPAGPKKAAMETPCNMPGTFMENRG